MHLRWVLWVLALAVAAGAVAHFARALFRSEPLLGWGDALGLRRALNAGRATLTFDAYVEVRPLLLNLTLDGRGYRLRLTSVLVCFRARGAPAYVEALPQLWRAWGNGTHAGAISLADASDDGSTVTVRYASASPGRAASVCLRPASGPDYKFATSRGGSVELGGLSYSWSGRREVVVLRLDVTTCG